MMRWTESQREAIEMRGRRVLVSAGAGSGKTRVLVERFLRLLEENADWHVSDIVAVTFTEKAAREMRARIRREIRSRIEKTLSAEERRRWREHRNALDSARIGTIHSLCAQILRAHTVEARLDPAFEVGDEVELAALLDQAIEEAITEAAGDSSSSQAASDTNIFAYLSPREAQSALRSLVAMGERALSSIKRLPHANAREIYDYWRDRLLELKREAASSLVQSETWSGWSRTITTLRAPDDSDRREQCRAEVADLLARLSSAEGDMSEAVGVLLEIAAKINLRGGSKKKWRSEEEFMAVRDALERMREAIRGERTLWLSMND
ncbi:MAG TPA: UvrD-helicase domain-containing protein, partial [Blastocatellia bacterium]|nr:UvrD-helicase domain-containing protein [Blastocatellia bacterium]